MTAVALPLDPKWGYDPWLGPGVALTDLALASAKTFAGADAIGADLHLLPKGLSLYGSYVDNFGGFPALEKLGLGGFLLSYTIFGRAALCADVEPGAMVPSDLPHWHDHVAVKDSEGNSWAYTNAANMAAVVRAMDGRKFIRISAHFGHGPHICGPTTCGFPQAHWTQWDDKDAQGQDIDRLIGTYLPVKSKPPPPPKPAGGIWKAALTYDPVHNHFTIEGVPGENVVFSEKPKLGKATITVEEHTGAWTIKHE